jgi:large subunit ribosomal protein L35
LIRISLACKEPKSYVNRFFHKMKKTHKGIAKRFKITGTGKVKFRKPGQRHLRRKRTTKQVRAGNQDQVLAEGMARRVIRALS